MKLITIIATLALASCATTTITSPDGTVTTVKSADPVAVAAISNGLAIYAESRQSDRAIIIAEK